GTQQPQPHRVDGAAEPFVERTDGSVITGQESLHQLLLLPREQRAFVSYASLHEGLLPLHTRGVVFGACLRHDGRTPFTPTPWAVCCLRRGTARGRGPQQENHAGSVPRRVERSDRRCRTVSTS